MLSLLQVGIKDLPEVLHHVIVRQAEDSVGDAIGPAALLGAGLKMVCRSSSGLIPGVPSRGSM